MKFSIRHADKIVGTLVLLALAMLVVVIFMIGRSQRWFKTDYQYISYFEEAKGLSKNMAVQYKGLTIGYVKDFYLADDDRIETKFTIFEEYIDRWVKEGSIVELAASPIGLGNSFLFYPGKGERVLDEGSLIPDINSKEGQQYLAKGLAEKTDGGDSIGNIINNVNALLETINISLAGAEGAADLALGQVLLNLEQALRTLDKTLANIEIISMDIRELTSGLSDPDSSIMQILDSEGPVYTELTDSIASLADILGDVSRTTDVLPAQLPVILNDLTLILRQVQDVLTSVSNNPILKGGIPERTETGPGGANNRDLEF